MKTLFKIYEELYKAGVKVYSYNLCDTPAVTIEANKQYAIFFNPNEEKASRWAIQHVVPHEEYIHALHNGICEVWDLAEYFCVTESFMRKAIHYYQMLEQNES